MNFATLKGITIPEGVVTQITDENGTVLWSGVVTTVYTITSDLTNVASSYNATSIIEGDSFTTTLTATVGEIQSVTVTMDGVDITSSVYNSTTGNINITNVTGNIIITAVAEEILPSYTNVLDTAGYETGYRLNSSATTTARADRCVTGFIPAKFGDTVYFKNIEMLKDDYGCMVAFYNSNKEKINAYLCSAAGSACTWLDDNTLKSFKMQHSEQIAYVRFCFVSITNDSIITVNEPIE